MTLTIIGVVSIVVYLIIGYVLSAIVMINHIEETKSWSNFEYCLTIVIAIIAWPYFVIRALIELHIEEKKENGKH